MMVTVTDGQNSANDAESQHTTPQGLGNGFEAYATVHREDYARIFESGTVIFDTNTLLNLYRYTPSVCSDFLDAMSAIIDRVWVPHQVVAEFWRNRESALSDFNKATEQATLGLQKGLDTQRQAVNAWAKRVSLSEVERDGILDRLAAVTESTASDLSGHRGAWLKEAEDTSKDRILRRLDGMLTGRVGAPFSTEERQKAKTEANRRIELEIPPGYEDKRKSPDKRVGDYFVWLQILRQCADDGWQDVLFVTGDTKPDWWRHDDRGDALGPRVELCEELLQKASARLYMLRPEHFLQHVSDIMGLTIANSSLAEVEKVDLEARLARFSEILMKQRQQSLHIVSEYLQYLSATGAFHVIRSASDEPADLIAEKGQTLYYITYFSIAKAVSAVETMRKMYGKWSAQFDSAGGYETKFVALFASPPGAGYSIWGDTGSIYQNAYAVWYWGGEYMGTAGTVKEGLAESEI